MFSLSTWTKIPSSFTALVFFNPLMISLIALGEGAWNTSTSLGPEQSVRSLEFDTPVRSAIFFPASAKCSFMVFSNSCSFMYVPVSLIFF